MTSSYFAAIALGHMVAPTGEMSPVLRLRAGRAVEFFKAGRTQRLIVSGGQQPAEPRSAAAAMKEFALAEGVPEQAIVEQGDAQDTVGEAIFTRFLLLPPTGSRLLLITSADHARRAGVIFRYVYGPAFTIDVEAIEDTSEIADRSEEEARSLARFQALFAGIEAGDDRAILERFWSRHALYAGDAFADIRRRTFDTVGQGDA